jgi:hypothetical protein
MTESPRTRNAPIFVVLAGICLFITVALTYWLQSLPYQLGNVPFFAIFPFAVISLVRRERWWGFSVGILLAALLLILWWTGASGRNTTPAPVITQPR